MTGNTKCQIVNCFINHSTSKMPKTELLYKRIEAGCQIVSCFKNPSAERLTNTELLCCSAVSSSVQQLPDKDIGSFSCSVSCHRKGVIAWIAQGLEKVVPQPDVKSRESPPAEQPTEVHQKLLQDVLH